MPMLFPVNSLRSRALLLARTELVLVLDGDMLVHSGLHPSLAAYPARCCILAGRRQTSCCRTVMCRCDDARGATLMGGRPHARTSFQFLKIARAEQPASGVQFWRGGTSG